MTRLSALLLLAWVHSIDALSTTPRHQQPLLPSNDKCTRRHIVSGWLGTTGMLAAVILTAPQASLADDGGVNVNDFLKTGQVAQPMGVSGQAGKSRPETGVILRDGSDVSRDPRTGDVLAEIVVDGGKGNTAVLARYSSPWPLAKGTVFDVECRDASTGDGAFLAVTTNVGGKTIDQLSDAFILNNLVKPDGRLSFYGPPTDVKVKSSQVHGDYKVMDLSYSIVSQATQTEIPRKARLSVTIPSGSDQAVMLVASASANRWTKGSDKLVASTIESFHAVPAPQSSLKVRAKSKERDTFL